MRRAQAASPSAERSCGRQDRLVPTRRAGTFVAVLCDPADPETAFLRLTVAERDHSGSTFVRVNWAKRTIMVEVKTLDQVVAGEPVPELVKIDAEGYDLKVVDGAKTLLGKTDVFLIEAMICGEYENTAPSRHQSHGTSWL